MPLIATIKSAALAVATVLASSLDYDPRVLVVEYQDGAVARMAATNPKTCNAAVRAIERGLWVPVGEHEVATAWCEPGSLFKPGSDCIANYNCP